MLGDGHSRWDWWGGGEEVQSLGRRFWVAVWIGHGIRGDYGDDGSRNGVVCGGLVRERDGRVSGRDGEDGLGVSGASKGRIRVMMVVDGEFLVMSIRTESTQNP